MNDINIHNNFNKKYEVQTLNRELETRLDDYKFKAHCYNWNIKDYNNLIYNNKELAEKEQKERNEKREAIEKEYKEIKKELTQRCPSFLFFLVHKRLTKSEIKYWNEKDKKVEILQ